MADRTGTLKSIKQRYNIVGNCDALNRALELAVRVARVDLSVIVLGENGVGKEIIPRIIHDSSNRNGRKYLALNCGAIPEGTIDSELFGHVEGAFTGSIGRREGYFAAADGGTLFLDEVGELPLQTQVRLLRVLETGEYIPVGANEPRKTNVRIVAATNVDMQRAIRDGRFREDLFYRLSAVTINVPPLRERGTDIDMLFRMFALENQEKYMMAPVRLNPEAREMLLHYPWPGNVRQLRNVVESMSILCDNREITPEVLQQYIPVAESSTQLAPIGAGHYPAHNGTKVESHDMEIIMHMIKSLAQEVNHLRDEVELLKQERSGRTALMLSQSFDRQHRDTVAAPSAFGDDDAYVEVGDDDSLAATVASPASSSATSAGGTTVTEVKTLQELEEQQIRESLARNNGNRRKTALELNLSERTLYRKINEMGLNRRNKND